MFEDINFHRAAVADHIAKSFINDFGSEEDLEKAHKVGDVHPNGKWVWKEYAPGKFDWRGIKGGSSSGGSSAPQASASQLNQQTSSTTHTLKLNLPAVKPANYDYLRQQIKGTNIYGPINNLDIKFQNGKYEAVAITSIKSSTAFERKTKWESTDGQHWKNISSEKIKAGSFKRDTTQATPAQQSAPAKRPQAPIQKPQAPATKTAQQKLKTNFQDAKDLAESIAKFVGGKAKQRKDIWGFGNWGDYGATTAVKDVYEVNIDDTHKIQIGIADGNSKSWMQPVKGEIVIRSAVKKSNNAGKKVFKWWSDAIKSYKPGEDFNKFVDSMPGTQKGIFRKLYE